MRRAITLIFLLVLIPAYTALAVTPAVKEFTSGNRKVFTTAGHPKSKGINMKVSYPASWLAKEGERPNIVKKFHSERGKGLELVFITTKQLELAPSESDLKELFTPTAMKDFVPPGAKFIQAKPTILEALPAGILEYSMRQERLGATIASQFISYIFVHGTTMVWLTCGVSADQATTPTQLARKMEDFKPLFLLMANSIVLENRWR